MSKFHPIRLNKLYVQAQNVLASCNKNDNQTEVFYRDTEGNTRSVLLEENIIDFIERLNDVLDR